MGLLRNRIGVNAGSVAGLDVMFRNADNSSFLQQNIRGFESEQREMKQWLTPEVKEQLFFSEPLSCAGINKTISKMITPWFDIDSPKKDVSLPSQLHDLLFDFYEIIMLRQKTMTLINDAMVHGNGYLELIPDSIDNNSQTPLLPSMGLHDVVNVDPLMIRNRVIWIDKTKNLYYYQHKDVRKGGDYFIHCSRIIHVPWFKLGTMIFGLGVYDVAFRSLMAKIGMDWSIGEVIYRHGKPFLVINVKNGTNKEVETAIKILKKLTPRTHFAGSDRTEFKMLQPSAVDPDPFARFYYINMAAACEMPQMEFLGVQSGQLTGSQVDKASWHQTLASKQEMKITPVINRINNQFLNGRWNGAVYWNPIYVDEKAKAETDLLNAQYIKTLYYDANILLDSEARQLCRDMGLPFPADDNDYNAEYDANMDIKQTPFDKDTADFMSEQMRFWKERYNEK